MRVCFGRVAGWLSALVFIAATLPVEAGMRRVDPGERPELKPGEGFVLVAVDTGIDLHSVRLNKDGRHFGAGQLSRVPTGRSFDLYVAPIGTYAWREVRPLLGVKYALGDDPEFKFDVKAGQVTYPGELLFRPIGLWRADVSVSNRALAAIDWLERTHPHLYARHPFVYSGRYPDPFPAFYRHARRRHADFRPDAPSDSPTVPLAGTLPVAIDTLWRAERIQRASLSPGGTRAALLVREDVSWGVELIDLKAGTSVLLARSDTGFSAIDWSGDDVLLLSMGASGTPNAVSVVRMDVDAAGAPTYARIDLPWRGVVVDPLPRLRDRILFASVSAQGRLMVHRIDIASQQAVNRFRPSMRTRLNTGIEGDVGWHTDGEGRLRLATVKRGDDYVLMHENDGRYSPVMSLSREEAFTPLGLSDDAGVIYGLSDQGRAQVDLVAFDVATRTIARTLFSRPGVDVASALFDAHRRPIGVAYYRNGRLVNEYFHVADRRLGQLLEQAFPGRTVAMLDRSDDGRHVLLWVDASDEPARIYHLDADRRTAALLAEVAPWLTTLHFAPTEVVPFQSGDGLSLEAFLTLPPGEGEHALVVMPHGGPIGVADSLHFDREVQFLASLGYAVLRVNFRGSAGYGRAFREAGHGMHGTSIEDDIDAAISHVLARYPLDEARMCIVGTSYGGYSALVSAVRWPQRFRCVVSIAGVSDRLLFFTASDSGRSEDGRRALEKIVGDPRAGFLRMQDTSPLYRYENLRTPVMLAHGLEDRRVDFEHARRMARMLTMAGRAPVSVEFDDEGHGIAALDNIVRLWSGVAGFLREHLGETDVARPVAAASAGGIAP